MESMGKIEWRRERVVGNEFIVIPHLFSMTLDTVPVFFFFFPPESTEQIFISNVLKILEQGLNILLFFVH